MNVGIFLMDYKLIGLKIRDCRKHNHLSQENLAELINVSVTYMGAIENARKHPSLATLVNIANVLGTTPDFLLGGNLWHDIPVIKSEFGELMEDCTPHERHIILALVKSLKSVLREYTAIHDSLPRHQ